MCRKRSINGPGCTHTIRRRSGRRRRRRVGPPMLQTSARKVGNTVQHHASPFPPPLKTCSIGAYWRVTLPLGERDSQFRTFFFFFLYFPPYILVDLPFFASIYLFRSIDVYYTYVAMCVSTHLGSAILFVPTAHMYIRNTRRICGCCIQLDRVLMMGHDIRFRNLPLGSDQSFTLDRASFLQSDFRRVIPSFY